MMRFDGDGVFVGRTVGGQDHRTFFRLADGLPDRFTMGFPYVRCEQRSIYHKRR
jgi:hypothetical protein